MTFIIQFSDRVDIENWELDKNLVNYDQKTTNNI